MMKTFYRFLAVFLVALIVSSALLWNKEKFALAQGSLPAVTISDSTAIEGNAQGNDAGASITFVLALSKASTQTVTVNWQTANGAARAPGDYTASSGQIAFLPGMTSQMLSVPLINDVMDEENELFYILLTSAEGAVVGRGRSLATIEDDDPPPTISIENAVVPEGNSGERLAIFRLRLSAPSGKGVRVQYATRALAEGQAANAGDYVPVETATAAFNVGYDVALARVVVKGDALNEPDEKFALDLSQPLNATLAASQTTGTILNDDREPSLSVDDVIVNESTGRARFNARLSAPSGKAISVNWQTANGIARTPGDYTAQNGVLNFAPGETNRVFDVPVIADTTDEGSENFYALLSTPINAGIGRGRGTATLLDGDKTICPPLTKIRFFPRAGYAARLFRGQFYGSNAGPDSQLQFITMINTVPVEGQWNEVVLDKPLRYRFLKFEAPNNSFGGLAELEFLWDNVRIVGTPLGSASAPGSLHTFYRAFDGDTSTFFEGAGATEQWVALDLGADVQAKPPVFAPPPGTYADPITITISSPTPNAQIRITRGGQSIFRNTGADPTRDVGEIVTAPFLLDKSTVLSAIAYTENLAASPAVVGAYRIESTQGDPATRVRTFHIGNSLTFGMDRWLQPLAQSAEKPLDYHRFTFSGAAIDYLWTHPGSGFGDTHYPEALQILAPINHIFTQPFAGRDKPIENEAEYSQKFYDLARQNSPNVQAWLYAQWPGKPFSDNRSQGKGSAAPLNLTPATTWQEGVANHLKFIEAVRLKVNQTYKGKPVLIVPVGSALATLKTEIDAGRVPGLTDFWQDISADGLHLTYKGNYMVALVFYSCLFKESPEGKVSVLDSGLTPEQAAIFQRIAWQTARNYPLSGVMRPL
jgi:hypothetical protein